jgi:hypothetical protein
MKKYNWTRVGTLYLTKAKYTLAHNLLIRELDKVANLTISRSILENQSSYQYSEILRDFQLYDIKIIIGIFDQDTALRLFCEIYKLKMYGENYQWIILGSYNSRRMFANFNYEANCSIEEVLMAINGTLQTRVVQNSFEFESKLNPPSNIIEGADERRKRRRRHPRAGSFQNSLTDNYEDIVIDYLDKFYENFHKNEVVQKSACLNQYFHGYAFDLLLAIFKALSMLIEENQFSCQDLNFKRSIDWFSLLNSAFNKISFRGVTVNLLFDRSLIFKKI